MTNTLNKENSAILKDQIREMNAGKFTHAQYAKRVRELFNLKKVEITEKKLYFLAGFIEGEGSISVSAKKTKSTSFGLELDPLFNITQRVEGVCHLYLALEVFKTGRIRFKTGSNATLVFVIEPRKSLQEKVCPFFDQYMIKSNFSSDVKQTRYQNFKKMLDLFDDDAHLNRERFIYELLPVWDAMRVQKSYTDQTFKDLKEAQEFIRNYKKLGSSETTRNPSLTL